jgi:hypothetical protein
MLNIFGFKIIRKNEVIVVCRDCSRDAIILQDVEIKFSLKQIYSAVNLIALLGPHEMEETGGISTRNSNEECKHR